MSQPSVAPRHPGTRQLGSRKVPDDLAWMRQPAHRNELISWLRAERQWYDVNALQWAPWHARLLERADQLLSRTSETPAWLVGPSSYRWRWNLAADHPTLVRRQHDVDQIVLDVNTLSTSGFVRIGDLAVSPDDHHIAYTVDTAGDEAYSLVIVALESLDAPTVLSTRVYYGLVWSADGQRLLYLVHDHADRPYQVWSIDINTAGVVLIYQEVDERFHLSLRASGDGQHAIIRSASRVTSEEVVFDLSNPDARPEPTLGRTTGCEYTIELCDSNGTAALAVAVAGEQGSAIDIRLLTDLGTAVRRLLPAGPTRRVRNLTSSGATLIAAGREQGQSCVWLLDLNGLKDPKTISSSPGSSVGLSPYQVPTADLTGNNNDHSARTVCLEISGLTHPTRWEVIDAETGRKISGHDPAAESTAAVPDVVIEELRIKVRDGVEVPVTVLRRSDIALDGHAPCLLYGYGAWETVIEPSFDPALLALVETGVVYAHAHIRGGGEFGSSWSRAGRLEHKQRTFDDFADVATALGADLVDATRIVAHGLSAGGLLMGASYSQRPELWAGVLAEAPFVDPVTTMSDAMAPLVIVEREEWGDPRHDDDLERMLTWSPFDNPPARANRPRLLVTTAIVDPRVSAWEPARWVARLREQSDPASVLLRADVDARGHWPPPGRWKATDFRCHLLAWVADTMGLDASV